MKQRYIVFVVCLFLALRLLAQERTVENRPYCDLRPFHFGVVVGTHLQDLTLNNVGIQNIIDENGAEQQVWVTCDQDRWDNGFHVGVLGETRLGDYFALRVAPMMYFGNRHIMFRNFSVPDANGKPTEVRQDMKTAYVMCDIDLIYSAKRFNNHRPYIMMGLSPAINLSTKANDYLQLKRTDVFFEAGLGCDFYLPFFKLRPELKFMYSLGNSLNTEHAKTLRDPNMLQYANSVNKANSNIIALTFYFE